MNAAMPEPLAEAVVTKVYERAFGDLASQLAKIAAHVPDAPPKRGMENYFEEVLLRLRRLENRNTGTAILPTVTTNRAGENQVIVVAHHGDEASRLAALSIVSALSKRRIRADEAWTEKGAPRLNPIHVVFNAGLDGIAQAVTSIAREALREIEYPIKDVQAFEFSQPDPRFDILVQL